jgi:hypothetical protein
MPPICDTKCGTPPGGGAGGVVSATKIDNPGQTVPPGVVTEADFTSVVFDFGPAITPDLVDNALVIEQDGLYEVIASEIWLNDPDGAVFASAIHVNGAIVQSNSLSEQLTAKAGSYSVLLELSAGDRVTMTGLTVAAGDSQFSSTLAAYKL